VRARLAWCGVLLALATAVGADDALDGSAFIDRGPNAEEQAAAEARMASADAYVACLKTEADAAWLGNPDFSPCDGARSAYAVTLAAEVANAAIGCLEEGVLGAPRSAGLTCAALHARFAAEPVRRVEGGAR